MDIVKLVIGNENSYKGAEGCFSILRQNCISAEQTEFPFRFTVNLAWTEDEINSAISQIGDYIITFDSAENVFTINKQDQ